MKVNIRFVQSVAIFGVWLLSIVAIPASTVYASPAVSNVQHLAMASPGGVDSDHDGLTNKQERSCGTNPKVADSDHNGILDGADDKDHDGLSNSTEFATGTKCRSKDTDHDGILDGLEVKHGTNPKKADSDGDGIKDGKDSEPNDKGHH